MDDLISELRKISHDKNDDASVLVMGKNYSPITLSKNNFHSIISSNEGGILFVDGGNAIIFESAGFCLGIIRVAGLKYKNNKRVMRDVKEFYALIKEEKQGDTNKFLVKTFPSTSFDGLVFDPEDNSLKNGMERSSCSRIIPVIRRFAELEHAYTLDDKDISFILLDGTLETRYLYEQDYLKKLLETEKVCALSKTCSLTTNNGPSITKTLLDYSSDPNLNAWYYYPIIENHNPEHDANIYFIRLGLQSDYVFRFEIQKNIRLDIPIIMGLLLANSRDPIFLGYPYGLVDVDNVARISLEECRLLKTRLMIELGQDWNELSKSMNSLNAHDILDKIKF
jgi:hypothetical protein